MKSIQVIYEDAGHKWHACVRDPNKPAYLVDTNEYLVVCEEDAILLDPGGSEIFPQVFAAISEVCDPREVKKIFASHQDPDIISSLSMWGQFNPEIECYISALWANFIPHFGGDNEKITPIPDPGMDIHLGRVKLQAIPAHYLHSSGNFHLYDSKAKILFSGDVGAALLPENDSGVFVEDFGKHIRYAEHFHQRWMGSEKAKKAWCERVSNMDIDMLCPQHGAIYQGQDVKRFIDWFAHLDIGSGKL